MKKLRIIIGILSVIGMIAYPLFMDFIISFTNSFPSGKLPRSGILYWSAMLLPIPVFLAELVGVCRTWTIPSLIRFTIWTHLPLVPLVVILISGFGQETMIAFPALLPPALFISYVMELQNQTQPSQHD